MALFHFRNAKFNIKFAEIMWIVTFQYKENSTIFAFFLVNKVNPFKILHLAVLFNGQIRLNGLDVQDIQNGLIIVDLVLVQFLTSLLIQ